MDHFISSRHNPRVKDAARLRDRGGRRQQGRIIIDGAREIRRAMQSGVELRELFVCDTLLDASAGQLLQALPSSLDVLHVTPSAFAKLAFGDRMEGVVAVASTPQRSLADLKLPERAVVAVLEGVEKPGNLGAIVRTADAAAVAAVIVADESTDLYNPNAIRASAGTIFAVPLVAANASAVLAWLEEQSFAIFATRVDAAVDYRAVDYTHRAAIVLGSEAHGLSDIWRGERITAIKLPMLGTGDSLNVSVTAAVLFYDALRQCRPAGREGSEGTNSNDP